MKQSQGGSGGGKTYYKHNNKKFRTNKYQKQQQSNKKGNGNGYTNRNNGFHLVDGNWTCLCNKGWGFNKSNTIGLPSTHVFQKKW